MLYRTDVMIDFLKIDTQMGLTFSGIALTTADSAKRERVICSARKAYDTVVKLRHGVQLIEIDADCLDHDLSRLRTELEILAEVFLDRFASTAKLPGS